MDFTFSDFVIKLSEYGYLVVFLLVFLQEVGVPSPIPNELVMLFAGYWVFLGKLSLLSVVFAAFAGDILGSAILFTLFYFLGNQIMLRKPSWIPVTENKLERLNSRLQRFGNAGVFLGRLSPFIRGYVSVLSGFINFNPKKYAIIIVSTALIWALFYIVLGYILGPYWNGLSHYLSDIPIYFGLIPLTLFVVNIVAQLLKNSFART